MPIVPQFSGIDNEGNEIYIFRNERESVQWLFDQKQYDFKLEQCENKLWKVTIDVSKLQRQPIGFTKEN